MSRYSVVTVANLDPGVVLAPERYDPRRRIDVADGVPLQDICLFVKDTVNSTGRSPGNADRFVVLDTSGAHEGFLVVERQPVTQREIGSLKKTARPGDVIVSRLRPYLRQVAYVDPEAVGPTDTIACSTEFYVLRRLDDQSISFLVPYLLSQSVQGVLAAAQEGGHHPRVNEATLRSLRVPQALVNHREKLSREVETAAANFRSAGNAMARLISEVDEANRGQGNERERAS